jgi:chitinase
LKKSHLTSRVCKLTACLIAAGVLSACGGGDEPQDAQAPTASSDNGRANALAVTPQATAAGTTVAPYFATWAFNDHSYNTWSLMDAKSKTGLKAATLAFVVAGNGCSLDSGGHTIDVDMKSDISSFQAAGGKVIVSFGGADGAYLESHCTASQMSTLIDGLIQRHALRDLDFDVEGSQASSSKLNTVRSAAIKTLQAKYPDLKVSFTLAVMPDTGLDPTGIAILKSAVGAGVKVNVVNVMAMDYGYNGDMGQFAIQAVRATAQQLANVFPGKSNAQLVSMVGITPMIGHNDDSGVFTLAHAAEVVAFAESNATPLLAFWDLQRDAKGAAGDKGSGSNSSNFQFIKEFDKAATAAPSPSCSNAVTWVDGKNYPKGTIVKFTNGKYYLEVNNGTNGSDGTDPTISTWYWQPTNCN